jgi:hypothetical protein
LGYGNYYHIEAAKEQNFASYLFIIQRERRRKQGIIMSLRKIIVVRDTNKLLLDGWTTCMHNNNITQTIYLPCLLTHTMDVKTGTITDMYLPRSYLEHW